MISPRFPGNSISVGFLEPLRDYVGFFDGIGLTKLLERDRVSRIRPSAGITRAYTPIPRSRE
jgi:hypothetical protein